MDLAQSIATALASLPAPQALHPPASQHDAQEPLRLTLQLARDLAEYLGYEGLARDLAEYRWDAYPL